MGLLGEKKQTCLLLNVGTMQDYARGKCSMYSRYYSDQNPLLLPFCVQVALVANEASVVFCSVARYTG